MNILDTAFAYQQSTASAASSVGQVVALYDRILRDLRSAIAAIGAGQIENRVNSLNHALTIIGELQGVLDFQRGGEAARNLNSFYTITRGMVTEAGVTSSVDQLQELVSMFARLRAAWAQVERTVAPVDPTQRLRVSSQARAQHAQNISPSPEHSVGAETGGWRA
ncbi:MAG TPA: flagellar export chaperone FliS [Candidatus Baltobacteraceae bacterium]|nr:flagellar export chaperone FliS [Candidatus Baltobacteraceae bacterium]